MYDNKLLSFLGISQFEIALYFFNIFCDSVIIVCAFTLFLGCLFGCFAYLSFMKKNEQTQVSILNVLYGYLAVFSIITSLGDFIDVLGEKNLIDSENWILCSAFNVKRVLRVVYVIIFLQLTIAIVLYHIRPDLYLKLSLIGKNKIGFLSVLLLGVFHLLLSLQDCQFGNLCSDCFGPTTWLKIFNLGTSMLIMISCLLIQLGVFIDVKFGLKNIWKRITKSPPSNTTYNDVNGIISRMVCRLMVSF